MLLQQCSLIFHIIYPLLSPFINSRAIFSYSSSVIITLMNSKYCLRMSNSFINLHTEFLYITSPLSYFYISFLHYLAWLSHLYILIGNRNASLVCKISHIFHFHSICEMWSGLIYQMQTFDKHCSQRNIGLCFDFLSKNSLSLFFSFLSTHSKQPAAFQVSSFWYTSFDTKESNCDPSKWYETRNYIYHEIISRLSFPFV